MCCRLALARVTPKSTQNYTPSRTSCTRSSTASSTRVSSTSAWERWPPGSNPHRGLPVTHAGEGHEFGYGSVLRGATFKTWQIPTMSDTRQEQAKINPDLQDVAHRGPPGVRRTSGSSGGGRVPEPGGGPV